MRPQSLFPLFASVTALAGVGPRLAKLVERAAGARVVDLLWHLPTGLIDRRQTPAVRDAETGAIATLKVTVEQHLPPSHPRLPYKVRCRDDTGFLHLVFFHPRLDYLKQALPVGAERVVSGRVERYRDEIQITHPDHIAAPEELSALAAVEPVYRLTEGLSGRVMARAVKGALVRAPDLAEWLDPAFLAREQWPGWRPALRAAHAPESEADLEPSVPSRRRLAFDELLATHLALALIRRQQRRRPGRMLAGDGRLQRAALAALPFALTHSQTQAVAEITADLASGTRMLRLLQGDVGSGKTVVALMAMLAAVECGAQAALMAPTEILARQHLATIAPLAAAAGVEVALLTGRDKGAARASLLAGLAEGRTPIAIGTHALFQEDVVFRDLALAVVDEQHRFGVHQRLELTAKGHAVDMLVMTATPIPRTLLLATYGDMEVSRLTEKPPGRRPVDTRTVSASRFDEVVAAVAREVAKGGRVFWVCPLVEESEAVDLAAASERHADLSERLGAAHVGLVHGRLKAAEKDRAMARFADGSTPVLVATTVIEVGVDVPEATVMVIEHAERFGLAQLHQLRGRIGRGTRPSTCLLLYHPPLGATARARLAVLRESDDGFHIAEEDLKLRGAGEVLGTRQSGLPEFRLVDLVAHGDLMEVARDEARLLVERDPELEGPRGPALRTLLYLFERDAAVRLLRSG